VFCDPTVGPDTTTGTLSRFDGDERRLGRYLRERTEDGEFYFKSKFIADDLDMTPSQVGTLVDRLRGATTGLDIEPWAYTNATTWRVTRAGED
jgi:hypothetical protein